MVIRFVSEAELPLDPGWSMDILPVTGPILVDEQLVQVGFYGHITQTSKVKAILPPIEAVRHCWLYMYRVDQ